jgi:hypothetical protein
MVWYGMVWYGMVWYGMVWYGMVWYGMVWYGMVWYGDPTCGQQVGRCAALLPLPAGQEEHRLAGLPLHVQEVGRVQACTRQCTSWMVNGQYIQFSIKA